MTSLSTPLPIPTSTPIGLLRNNRRNCRDCGGQLQFPGAIEERTVVEKIRYLGLPAEPGVAAAVRLLLAIRVA